MGHLAKQRDASFFRVFFNPYHYGVLTVICSEVVDFVAEWRAYIRYGQVEGVRPYYGDWHFHYDPKIIENCLNDYENKPAGFSLDFGVTKKGETLLVEVNEGYSLAAYGLYDIRYAKLLAARWAELTGTVDECVFDLKN